MTFSEWVKWLLTDIEEEKHSKTEIEKEEERNWLAPPTSHSTVDAKEYFDPYEDEWITLNEAKKRKFTGYFSETDEGETEEIKLPFTGYYQLPCGNKVLGDIDYDEEPNEDPITGKEIPISSQYFFEFSTNDSETVGLLKTTVKDIEKKDLQFISDSQDVSAIKEYLGETAEGYDSFFVKVEEGDYVEVYGMYGIVPTLDKPVYKIKTPAESGTLGSPPFIDETPNEYRVRIEEPGKYEDESFRYKKISDGVSIIVACPEGKWKKGKCAVGTQKQAYRFSKDKFKSKEEVREWLKKWEVEGCPTIEETEGAPQNTRTTYDLYANGRLYLNFETKNQAEAFVKLGRADLKGKKIEIKPKISRKYSVGDMWRDDFDYEGMVKTGISADIDWGEEKLEKLFDSFEDVNYHGAGAPLWDAIKFLKSGDKEKAKEKMLEFNELCKKTIDEFRTEGVERIIDLPEPLIITEGLETSVIKKELTRDINRAKDKLIAKAKRSGLYEDFGQKEVRMLKDKYHYNDLIYGSSAERGLSKMIDNFDNWCMNFDLSKPLVIITEGTPDEDDNNNDVEREYSEPDTDPDKLRLEKEKDKKEEDIEEKERELEYLEKKLKDSKDEREILDLESEINDIKNQIKKISREKEEIEETEGADPGDFSTLGQETPQENIFRPHKEKIREYLKEREKTGEISHSSIEMQGYLDLPSLPPDDWEEEDVLLTEIVGEICKEEKWRYDEAEGYLASIIFKEKEYFKDDIPKTETQEEEIKEGWLVDGKKGIHFVKYWDREQERWIYTYSKNHKEFEEIHANPNALQITEFEDYDKWLHEKDEYEVEREEINKAILGGELERRAEETKGLVMISKAREGINTRDKDIMKEYFADKPKMLKWIAENKDKHIYFSIQADSEAKTAHYSIGIWGVDVDSSPKFDNRMPITDDYDRVFVFLKTLPLTKLLLKETEGFEKIEEKVEESTEGMPKKEEKRYINQKEHKIKNTETRWHEPIEDLKELHEGKFILDWIRKGKAHLADADWDENGTITLHSTKHGHIIRVADLKKLKKVR